MALRRCSRYGRYAAGLVVTVSLFLGLGHVLGKQYAKRHQGGSCPFGAGRRPPFDLSKGSPQLQGEGVVAQAQLLTLTLGKTNATALAAWLATHHCHCRQKLSPFECRCDTPSLLGAEYVRASKTTIFAELDESALLSEVVFLTSFADAQTVQHAFERGEKSWAEDLGPITIKSGDERASFLAAGLFRQSRTEFHRKNVFARLTATNFGDHYNLEQRLSRIR